MNKKPYAETAQGLASMGRYGDSMLVHMTPGEVAGLQSLAQANGTSLTINPKTGLPEAFILAPLVGLGLKAAGMSALGAGIATGLLGWAVTGDLGQGLLSGLGGYGGAGLGGALGKFGAAQGAVSSVPTVGASAAGAAAPSALSSAATPLLSQAGTVAPSSLLTAGTSLATPATYTLPSLGQVAAAGSGAAGAGGAAALNAAQLASSVPTIAAGTPNIGAGISKAFADPKAFYNAYPDEALTAAGMAASPLIASSFQPPQFTPLPEEKTPYEGPYFPTERVAQFPTTQDILAGSSEQQYFSDVHPYPGFEPRRMANGGQILETPDGIGQNVQLSRDGYGLGSLSSRPVGFAPGGEIDYGLSSVSGSAMDPNSIPSVAFQEQLNAYDKSMKELTNPSMRSYSPFFYASGISPERAEAARNLNPFKPSPYFNYGRGLTRAQAEAKLGARPVWNPESIAPRAPVQQAVSQPVGGTGITQLPTRTPQMSAGPALAGFQNMASGIMGMAKGGYLDGAGDGMSDSIPATIGGKQPARLADGEFVIPADVVSHLGNGSTKAGAKRLYAMMDKVRQARTGTKKQGKQIKPEKYMPA